MSKYKVFLTERALKDLENISTYISDELTSPLAAVNIEINLTKTALSLEENPYRAPKFSEEYNLIQEKDIRKLIVGNYLILYYVEESQRTVQVVTIYNRLKKVHS